MGFSGHFPEPDLMCGAAAITVESFEHTDTEYLKQNDNASRDDG